MKCFPTRLAALVITFTSCTSLPANGVLRCGADSACPSHYHCATNQTCWQNGSDPPAAGNDAGATLDLLGADLSGAGAHDLAMSSDLACTSALCRPWTLSDT